MLAVTTRWLRNMFLLSGTALFCAGAGVWSVKATFLSEEQRGQVTLSQSMGPQSVPAAPASPLPQTRKATWEGPIDSTQRWAHTNLIVKPGDRLHITSSGQITYEAAWEQKYGVSAKDKKVGPCGDWFTPDAQGIQIRNAGEDFLLHKAKVGSLLVKIGSQIYSVCQEHGEIQVQEEGGVDFTTNTRLA